MVDCGFLAVAHRLAADNHYLCNRLAEARTELQAVRKLTKTLQNEDLLRCGDAVATLCTIAETGGGATCPPIALDYPGMLSFILRLIAIDLATRSLTLLGRGDDAWAVIQAAKLDDAGDLVEYQPRKLIPHLRGYLARAQEQAAVTGLIEDTLVYAGKIGERLVQLLALSAWQQQQLGDERQTQQRLTQALRLAEETGYMRVLLDIPVLAELLPACTSQRQSTSLVSPSRNRLLRPSIKLTEQEARVLVLLAADHTY
jgi:hypothetical protein